MKKIVVLMSTYNGELYLREQIDSILSQKDIELYLKVRDDGSTDSTVEILNEYAQKGKLTFSMGENCGVGNSFMKLLYETEGQFDLYAFSDQDDIWLPNKLICAAKKLQEQKGPVLYASNQRLVDGNGKYLGLRYMTPPSCDYHQILCANQLSGCTMVFNRELFLLLKDKKRRPTQELLRNRIHDVWVAMVASISGSIFWDEESYILYRQHEKNVVGARKKGMKDRIAELNCKIREPGQRQGRSRLAREISNKFPEVIHNRCEDLFIYGYYNEKIGYKMKLLEDKSIRQFSHEAWWALYLKVMLHLF